MRIAVVLIVVALTGCVSDRQPVALPSRACPPLPVLPDHPTANQRRAWTETVIAQYVRCAKGD